MKDAKMTKAGAKRIRRMDLSDKIVQYDAISESGRTVKDVYLNGKRITGMMSFVTQSEYTESGSTLGDNFGDPGLILQ